MTTNRLARRAVLSGSLAALLLGSVALPALADDFSLDALIEAAGVGFTTTVTGADTPLQPLPCVIVTE